MKIVGIRYVEMEGFKHHFCQMTTRISSSQKVRLLKEGQVVKETEETPITEHWVFEKIVNKPDSQWRYCGSIEI